MRFSVISVYMNIFENMVLICFEKTKTLKIILCIHVAVAAAVAAAPRPALFGGAPGWPGWGSADHAGRDAAAATATAAAVCCSMTIYIYISI